MSFPHPGAPPPAPPAEAPLRTFTYKTFTGDAREVEAHYIQFTSGHVTFWLQQDGDWDYLVRAETNQDCQEIKETT